MSFSGARGASHGTAIRELAAIVSYDLKPVCATSMKKVRLAGGLYGSTGKFGAHRHRRGGGSVIGPMRTQAISGSSRPFTHGSYSLSSGFTASIPLSLGGRSFSTIHPSSHDPRFRSLVSISAIVILGLSSPWARLRPMGAPRHPVGG